MYGLGNLALFLFGHSTFWPYGFLMHMPVWDRLCTLRLLMSQNAFWHSLHWYGFSPTQNECIQSKSKNFDRNIDVAIQVNSHFENKYDFHHLKKGWKLKNLFMFIIKLFKEIDFYNLIDIVWLNFFLRNFPIECL